jgi:hypothetical protein
MQYKFAYRDETKVIKGNDKNKTIAKAKKANNTEGMDAQKKQKI